MFLKFSLSLKTSSDNKNLDYEIVMLVEGCSGFVRHVMDAHSAFLQVCSKIYLQKQFSQVIISNSACLCFLSIS